MAFEKRVELRVGEDGQFEIVVTDTWGTERTVLSRARSKALAAALLRMQRETA